MVNPPGSRLQSASLCLEGLMIMITSALVDNVKGIVYRKKGIEARLIGTRIGTAGKARRRGRRMRRRSERGIRSRRQAGPMGPIPILILLRQVSHLNITFDDTR